jgi:hypothetical protein
MQLGHRRARVGTASWGSTDLLVSQHATPGGVAMVVNQESLSVGTGPALYAPTPGRTTQQSLLGPQASLVPSVTQRFRLAL